MAYPERIETSRLLIRWFDLRDAQEVFSRYAQDPEVTRFLRWRPHRSLADTQEYLRAAIAARIEGKRFAYAIRRRESGRLLGAIGIGADGPIASLGYLLARDAWGHGYATEAARAVVELSLGDPAVWRVEATCALENDASARVLERAGFAYEGILRRHTVLPNLSDAPSDVRMYARVKES
jgi:RimJ/RimL family protein N-acetyltransferase